MEATTCIFFYKTTAAADEIKNIVFETVRRLKAVGLNVLAVVSDKGSNFRKIVKKHLKLSEDNVFFSVDELKLLYLFDVPHLLKSTRNNFFSHVFKLANGETQKAHLEIIYNYEKTKEYRLCPKLTYEHINPNPFQKMKVKLASQIFSRSVATAMHTCNANIDFNILPVNAKITATFIMNMNNRFDLLKVI